MKDTGSGFLLVFLWEVRELSGYLGVSQPCSIKASGDKQIYTRWPAIFCWNVASPLIVLK